MIYDFINNSLNLFLTILRAVTDAEFISRWFLSIATTAWMQKVEQRRSSCRGAETGA